MNNPNNTSKDIFQKNRDNLWSSLQKHLSVLYKQEKLFTNTLVFTDAYPFNPNLIAEDKLREYWFYRNSLRDLFIDETIQLGNLIKAIKQKEFVEDEKKQLYLLILGYMDIAGIVFKNLEVYLPVSFKLDDELENYLLRFEKLKKYLRLNIKGVMPSY
jgi:hypothetical protein